MEIGFNNLVDLFDTEPWFFRIMVMAWFLRIMVLGFSGYCPD